MDGETQKALRPSYSKRYVLILGAVWTTIIVASLGWNLYQVNHNSLEQATEVIGAVNKELVYRRWAAGHGPVYVPVTNKMPPSHYLSHVENRDITSSTGQALTLICPACMIRQVPEVGLEHYGLRGHITSLHPLRPENTPDPWEKKALEAFENGEAEISFVEIIDGEAYMRSMRPVITEERCLKCHGAQGYSVGDIQGGISVSAPMAPYWTKAQAHKNTLMLGHGFIWIIGLLGIAFGDQVIRNRVREREKAEKNMQQYKNHIEELVEKHTVALLHSEERIRSLLNAASSSKPSPESIEKATEFLCALVKSGQIEGPVTEELITYVAKELELPPQLSKLFREMMSD